MELILYYLNSIHQLGATQPVQKWFGRIFYGRDTIRAITYCTIVRLHH